MVIHSGRPRVQGFRTPAGRTQGETGPGMPVLTGVRETLVYTGEINLVSESINRPL
jgi:hypothetical protein